MTRRKSTARAAAHDLCGGNRPSSCVSQPLPNEMDCPPTAKILVVEDEHLLLDVVCIALRNEGYQVQEATNGDQALTALRETEFDLIITDILMPDCDGIEIIRYIRARLPSLKIIAASGGGVHVSLDLLEMAQRLGACDVITKPLDLDVLLKKTASVLTSGHPARQDCQGPTHPLAS